MKSALKWIWKSKGIKKYIIMALIAIVVLFFFKKVLFGVFYLLLAGVVVIGILYGIWKVRH